MRRWWATTKDDRSLQGSRGQDYLPEVSQHLDSACFPSEGMLPLQLQVQTKRFLGRIWGCGPCQGPQPATETRPIAQGEESRWQLKVRKPMEATFSRDSAI